MNCLIGYSGFIGETLIRQTSFGQTYRSADIANIEGRSFETIVCAGAPAKKWLANRDPESDRRNIECLIRHLDSLFCETFILISTVDVFRNPVGVDESTRVEEYGLDPYGLHRRFLEKFVARRFKRHLIVRLPGLVGPGLRKNIIFDFLNENNLQLIDSRGIFQFYPTVNLWSDIQVALAAELALIHLTASPICVTEVSLKCFGRPFEQLLPEIPGRYDMQTQHADLFGLQSRYQYSTRETVLAIRAYAQSERLATTQVRLPAT